MGAATRKALSPKVCSRGGGEAESEDHSPWDRINGWSRSERYWGEGHAGICRSEIGFCWGCGS